MTQFLQKMSKSDVSMCVMLGVYKVGGEGGRGAPSSRIGHGS